MSDKKEESQPSTLSEAEAEQALAKAEYEAAKEEAEEAKPADGTLRTTTISDAVAASEAVAQAESAYEAAKVKVKAARETSEAAWKAEYEAAKAEAGGKRESGQFSNKRKQDRIFRREMGEPEFFLMDRDIPLTPILTGDQIEEIANDLRIRLTWDTLYGMVDDAILEYLDKSDKHYGETMNEAWLIEMEKNKKQFEMVDLVAPSWTIQVPRRKK